MPESYRRSMVVTSDNDKVEVRSEGFVGRLFLDKKKTLQGVHKSLRCVDCHRGMQKIPHPRYLPPVGCGSCHEDVRKKFTNSLHGRALGKNDPLAPRCHDCHGYHNITPPSDPKSATYKMNIPAMCGKCHRDGSKVQKMHDISKDHIVKNYTQSIHGEGLFKKGLLVTAVCTDCHSTHQIRPHTDPESSINAKKIAGTCMKCHAQIETVHQKVINGELWEKSPHMIPVCVDCHQPHKARKIFYDQGMSDTNCRQCHDREILVERGGKKVPLKIHRDDLEQSAHKDVACVKCHTGGSPLVERQCETIKGKVDCSICHAEEVDQFNKSEHGRLLAEGDLDVPDCKFCHPAHRIKAKEDPRSPLHPRNIPDLCGNCHLAGEKAAKRNAGLAAGVISNYKMSIHGKGLLESGLMVTATCVSCHNSHHILPADNPESSVHKEQVPRTCAKCHTGVYEDFQKSIHSPLLTKTTEDLPTCADCHSSHAISRADQEDFRLGILQQCGKCHEDITHTYFDTYHGKVSQLGSGKTAKCQDCHGAHKILPPEHPESTLNPKLAAQTCGKCHPGSHLGFTGYLAHATHNDFDKYPFVFISFWGMTLLLVGTFLVAGLHTLAWLPAAIRTRRQHGPHKHDPGELQYRRFPTIVSRIHFVIIISFFGLAITGMALKFSNTQWAGIISGLLGGFESMGLIHRFCAILTFGYAVVHLFCLARLKGKQKVSWFKFIFNDNSLMFNFRDLREIKETIKWFFGKGPRPNYGRWTYWEKFDYFAVFWGIAIIGSTGLMLWFPVFFTKFIPGRFLTVATVIHSDEALLAVGFIFTIHFFNTHFRPDKFPMDTVMFTGQMSLDELKKDKPREYEDWVKAGKPQEMLVAPLPQWYLRWLKVFGFVAVAVGLTLICLIFYGLVIMIF